MRKIFTGANGYYVAQERSDGFHYQPQDNGSTIGWDRAKAETELARQLANDRYYSLIDRICSMTQRERDQYMAAFPFDTEFRHLCEEYPAK